MSGDDSFRRILKNIDIVVYDTNLSNEGSVAGHITTKVLGERFVGGKKIRIRIKVPRVPTQYPIKIFAFLRKVFFQYTLLNVSDNIIEAISHELSHARHCNYISHWDVIDEEKTIEKMELIAIIDAMLFLEQYQKERNIIPDGKTSYFWCLNKGFGSVQKIIDKRGDVASKYPLWYLIRKRKDISSKLIHREITETAHSLIEEGYSRERHKKFIDSIFHI